MGIVEIIAILRKWMLLIIILPVLAVMATAFYYFGGIAPPVYTSDAQILAYNLRTEGEIQGGDLTLSANLINDFCIIVTSTPVLQETADLCGLRLSEVKSCSIRVSKKGDSRVVAISVSANTAALAENVTRALVQVSTRIARDLLSTKNITVIEPATRARQTGPASMRNTVISFIVGLAAGAGFALAVELLNTTVRSEADVEKHLKIPVLGKVPRFEK